MIESNKEYVDLCAMFTECNLVGNPREWWMDSGATCYVYANKELFSSFAPAQAEEMLYMANSATAKVEKTGKICLKMTSDTPNHQVIVCLYVDDMLIISRDISNINATKRMLESKFDMKDLGVADVILGIRIHRTPQGLTLSQSHYIEKVLDKFKYMQFGIAKTPLDASFALRFGNMGSRMDDSLIKDGYGVAVHDINHDVMKMFLNKGILTEDSPSKVAETSDVVIRMLPSSKHVLDVYTERIGFLSGVNLRRPWQFIDSSANDPQTSRKVSATVTYLFLVQHL
ncbi:putative 3-hydroxyisobutyrate dehydrogenase, mitochondrial [Capsicum annuum]|nr:putative 3-hydroxyisobutyrate dehydrogenase, mitochondrial [Capsicum annuum]